MRCTKCGNELRNGAKFCAKCGEAVGGKPLEKSAASSKVGIKCPKCGITVPDTNKFCNYCGHSLDQEIQGTEKVAGKKQKSRKPVIIGLVVVFVLIVAVGSIAVALIINGQGGEDTESDTPLVTVEEGADSENVGSVEEQDDTEEDTKSDTEQDIPEIEVEQEEVELTDETTMNADLYPKPGRTLSYQKANLMTGDDVKYIQAALSEMNYYGITMNGTYDSATQSAVKRFQKNHNYDQTGVVDEDMVEKIEDALNVWRNESTYSVQLTSETTANADLYPEPERSLRYIASSPMTGDDVKYVQAALIEMDYTDTTIYVNGTYDSYTEAAVRRFQTNHNLYVDGIVGTKTIAELKSALADWRKTH